MIRGLGDSVRQYGFVNGHITTNMKWLHCLICQFPKSVHNTFQIPLWSSSLQLREEPGIFGGGKSKRFLLTKKNRLLKLIILMLFYVDVDARVQAH